MAEKIYIKIEKSEYESARRNKTRILEVREKAKEIVRMTSQVGKKVGARKEIKK